MNLIGNAASLLHHKTRGRRLEPKGPLRENQ